MYSITFSSCEQPFRSYDFAPRATIWKPGLGRYQSRRQIQVGGPLQRTGKRLPKSVTSCETYSAVGPLTVLLAVLYSLMISGKQWFPFPAWIPQSNKQASFHIGFCAIPQSFLMSVHRCVRGRASKNKEERMNQALRCKLAACTAVPRAPHGVLRGSRRWPHLAGTSLTYCGRFFFSARHHRTCFLFRFAWLSLQDRNLPGDGRYSLRNRRVPFHAVGGRDGDTVRRGLGEAYQAPPVEGAGVSDGRRGAANACRVQRVLRGPPL